MALTGFDKKEYNRAWKKSPIGKISNRKSTYAWRENNWEKYLYYAARTRSKRLKLDFSIDLSDIVIPDLCPYLGIKLTRKTLKKSTRLATNASLDRIDSSKGYVKGNVRVISNLANRMKTDATVNELRAFAAGVLLLHGGIK